jgi:hypothetical protein
MFFILLFDTGYILVKYLLFNLKEVYQSTSFKSIIIEFISFLSAIFKKLLNLVLLLIAFAE